MHCDKCGEETADDDSFCPNCGCVIRLPECADRGLPSANEHAIAKSKALYLLIAIVLLIVGLMVCGIFAWLNWQEQHREYPISLSFSLEGIDENSVSPSPVRISGTDFEGNVVARNVYLQASGASEIHLKRGSYSASLVSCPITEDGTLLDSSNPEIDFAVDEDKSESVSKTVSLSPVSEAKVDESMIGQAKESLINSGLSADEAERYAQAASDKKKAYEEEAKKEEALRARTVTVSFAKIVLPEYWAGKVTVEKSGDLWIDIKDKKTGGSLCQLFLADSSWGDDGGDMGSSIVGSVESGGKRIDVIVNTYAILYSSAMAQYREERTLSESDIAYLVDLSTGGELSYSETSKWIDPFTDGEIERTLHFAKTELLPNISFS